MAALDRFTVFTCHYQHKTSTIYIHIDTICMDFPICILRSHRSNFLNFNIVLSLGIVFILANSAYEGMTFIFMVHLSLYEINSIAIL